MLLLIHNRIKAEPCELFLHIIVDITTYYCRVLLYSTIPIYKIPRHSSETISVLSQQSTADVNTSLNQNSNSNSTMKCNAPVAQSNCKCKNSAVVNAQYGINTNNERSPWKKNPCQCKKMFELCNWFPLRWIEPNSFSVTASISAQPRWLY